MIAITGANGNIGRHLVKTLAKARIPARLLMREPARASTVGDCLDVLAADLDHHETLDRALDGITRLFLLSPGPNISAQDEAAIAAAQRAGVQHIVLLQHRRKQSGGARTCARRAPARGLRNRLDDLASK
jgi:uncharacterized protein YbjT (DUF2867 family)